MHDAVQDSGSHDFVAQDSAPILEVSVGGEDSRLGFVAVADDFKEVVQRLWGKGSKADFVQYEQIRSDDLLQDAAIGVVGAALGEAFKQGCADGRTRRSILWLQPPVRWRWPGGFCRYRACR